MKREAYLVRSVGFSEIRDTNDEIRILRPMSTDETAISVGLRERKRRRWSGLFLPSN